MLEISCGIYQQKRISVMLRKVFGDNLFTPQEAKSKLLPTPNDLRNRVIIFLTHRKKDIDLAYKLNDKPVTITNPLTIAESKVQNNSIGSNVEEKKRRDSTISTTSIIDSKLSMTNWMSEIRDSNDIDSENSDDDISDEKPLNTIRQNPASSLFLPSSTEGQYHLLDPEAASYDIRRPDHNEEGAIDPSLMRLCHYSKSHRLSTHSLKYFIEKIDNNPEAEEAMIQFNMTKFW